MRSQPSHCVTPSPHACPLSLSADTKHHNAYVTNLNIALEKYAKASAAGNVAEMIALQPAIRFNGGGHVNHSIFWKNLAPAGKGGGGEPSGELAKLVAARWGSFAALKAAMNAAGAGVQGSGWVWLGYHAESGQVQVAACANQDPLSTTGLVPLLGIDVWEHAYYLQVRQPPLCVGQGRAPSGTL